LENIEIYNSFDLRDRVHIETWKNI